MPVSSLILGTTSLLVGGGLLESLLHRRRLDQIPIRIHVNGTRGKSSVTRLIAAGLREAGVTTCAKTTGTLPRMILPDGSEYAVFRPAKANVIEQLRIVGTAVECDAEALVMECMAVAPYLQWLSESQLVRATHGVITNARADHLDVMGPTERDVALALAGMIPRRGKLFTAERRHLDVLAAAAADRHTHMSVVGDDEVAGIDESDLARFSYVEHAENLALALRVCSDLGIDRATALRGMWSAAPDPGAMTMHELDFFGRQICFVNGFAANDPESTRRIWKMALQRHPDTERRIMIVNTRDDRPDRSRQLGAAVVDWPPADHYVLIGSGTSAFARTATQQGLPPLKLIFAEDRSVADVFEQIVELAGRSALVVGVANIGGLGLPLARFFANRATLGAGANLVGGES